MGRWFHPLAWAGRALLWATLAFVMGCGFFPDREDSPPDNSTLEAGPAFTAGPEATLEEAGGLGESVPVDSSEAVGLPGSDSAPGLPPTEDSSAVQDSTAAVESTAAQVLPTAQESTAVQESTTAQEPPLVQESTTLVQRVERLEAENDSLRAALGTLLSLLAPSGLEQTTSGADSTQLPTSADSASGRSELIAVDAEQVQHWGLRAAVAIVFLILSGLFIRLTVWVLEKLAERNAKRRLLFKRLVPIARISFWFVSILFVFLVIFRVEARGLIAAGAAVGVAIGFAAQDILKNIFGGLIVLFDQPFQVGDKISVGGTYGEVVSIGLRSTRIVTPDDNLVSVPNAQVVDGQVANANAGELNCQVVTDLFLPGWVDETEAKRIAFEAATSSKYVFLNKPVVVLVKDEFRETFLTHLKVKAYVLDPRYEFLFMSDVTERARAGFRKAGLLGPMHGVRAYVDMDGFPKPHQAHEGSEDES